MVSPSAASEGDIATILPLSIPMSVRRSSAPTRSAFLRMRSMGGYPVDRFGTGRSSGSRGHGKTNDRGAIAFAERFNAFQTNCAHSSKCGDDQEVFLLCQMNILAGNTRSSRALARGVRVVAECQTS